ncbi:phosphatase PAP2 family protein [Antribacter gilvus]|uniref:phosphatase PAP2 family protein n=1 Tax=Antribacter gilvus TaxID=2304675 RepID=UPI000F7A0982|nr:phosphatase PAP2 family protein [Antribacter gilvus]
MAGDVIATSHSATRPWRVSAVRDPATLTGAVSALLLGIATWQVLAGGPFVAWDWRSHLWADAHLPGGWVKQVLDGVASVGGERLFTLPVVIPLAAWLSYRSRSRGPLVAVLVGVATIAVVGYSLKFGLGRTMPWTGEDELYGGGRAFPSGHAANAAYTWAMVSYLVFGRGGLRPSRAGLRLALAASAVVALAVGAVMVVLDYHWLSDVPGGWLVGLLALAVSLVLLDRSGRPVPGEGRPAR